jgi:hypothetical protein
MLGVRVNGYYANHIHSAVDILGFTINGNYTDLIYQTVLLSKEIHIPVFTTLRYVTVTNTLILFEVSHPLCLINYITKKCTKYMVRTQLYIITQNSTYNYMFRPFILTIFRLCYKPKTCMAAYSVYNTT